MMDLSEPKQVVENDRMNCCVLNEIIHDYKFFIMTVTFLRPMRQTREAYEV